VDYSAIDNTKIDILLVRNNVKVDIERLMNIIKPFSIVLDATNSFFYFNNWNEVCKSMNIPIHYVKSQGAFKCDVMDIKKRVSIVN